MFTSLPQTIQDEIADLIQRYGQPVIRNVKLPTSDTFDPINKKDRYGEVCMVVRRKNGRLLTMIKSFYPQGAYRLLTGGINHNEYIFDALLRETQEETGLEVDVKQFLAIATYEVEKAEKSPSFYTFAFLVDEVSGTLGAVDEDEQVEGFREIEPDELLQIAEHLNNLGAGQSEELRGRWQDWGTFRAVIHQLVWEALQRS
jgi:8-oxo-dGTP pyrophosphatase MutT (NUDIX family)